MPHFKTTRNTPVRIYILVLRHVETKAERFSPTHYLNYKEAVEVKRAYNNRIFPETCVRIARFTETKEKSSRTISDLSKPSQS
jgi:hypothetical protein